MKQIHLDPAVIKILKDIFASHHFTTIIFGSRVREDFQTFSDIDICLKSNQPIDLKQLNLLRMACSESDLPYKVDIVDYHSIPESLKTVIDDEGIELSKNSS